MNNNHKVLMRSHIDLYGLNPLFEPLQLVQCLHCEKPIKDTHFRDHLTICLAKEEVPKVPEVTNPIEIKTNIEEVLPIETPPVESQVVVPERPAPPNLPDIVSMPDLKRACVVHRMPQRTKRLRLEKATKNIVLGPSKTDWLSAIRAEQVQKQRLPGTKYPSLATTTTTPVTEKKTKKRTSLPPSTNAARANATSRYTSSITKGTAASNYAKALARAKSRTPNSAVTPKSENASRLSMSNSEHVQNRIGMIRAQLTKATQRAQAESLARSNALKQQAALRKKQQDAQQKATYGI